MRKMLHARNTLASLHPSLIVGGMGVTESDRVFGSPATKDHHPRLSFVAARI